MRIRAPQFFELLCQSHSYERRLRERILLPYADPRSAVEWQVLPADPQSFPSLRPEFIGVRPIDVLAPVHRPDAVAGDGALFNEDRGFAVWTATEGKDGVCDAHAAVERDDGVEAESCEF